MINMKKEKNIYKFEGLIQIIIKLLRFCISVLIFFFGSIFLLSLYLILPIEILVPIIFIILLLSNFIILYKYKVFEVNNKLLIIILNKNYLYILKKFILIKIILLSGYSLEYSLCDSTFNTMAHNNYLNITTGVGFSINDSNKILQNIGLVVIISGLTYVAYNSYMSYNAAVSFETLTLEDKKALVKINTLVKECLENGSNPQMDYAINYKYYGSNIYQNELMKQNYLGSFKRSYSDTLLPALTEKKSSCSVCFEKGNIVTIYNTTTDSSFRHMFHGHTTEIVLKIIYFGIRNVLNNSMTAMAFCELLENFNIKGEKPTPDKVGKVLVSNLKRFLDDITNSFELK